METDIFEFLAISKNGLIRKIRLISKYMTSQPGLQTIAINILTNTTKSNDNQAMIFSQLMEYNMRNMFIEKSYTMYAMEILITEPFLKNEN